MRSTSKNNRLFHAILPWLGRLLAFGLGCSPAPLSLQPSGPSSRPSDYPMVLKAWTRSERCYQQFESRIFVDSTFRSLPYRLAYVTYMAHVQHWDAAQTQRVMQEERKASTEGHEFLVGVFTHQWSWNDLDEKDTIWHVSLENDAGRQAAPQMIQRLTRKLNEYEGIFPYLSRFTQPYLIRFPVVFADGRPLIQEQTRHVTLRISGVRGSVSLRWDLKP